MSQAGRKKKILDRLHDIMRLKHYSLRTEKTYRMWIVRYVNFHGRKHPAEMGEPEVEAFLTDLAVRQNVAKSTQNQALNALVFLYSEVLNRPLEGRINAIRAPRKENLPVVLSTEETARLLSMMSGITQLMAQLMYGSGLRRMECVRLRVHDIDLELKQVRVISGKGDKDRFSTLPEKLMPKLESQMDYVQTLHEVNRHTSSPRIMRLPTATHPTIAVGCVQRK